MITTTKFFVQHQRDAADFSDACEPICIGSYLHRAVQEFDLCRAHRRLLAIPCDLITNKPTGQGVELIRV